MSYRYISDSAAAALKRYKYAGEDRSYLYIHVLTPMNKFLVEFIPTYVAPNTITTIGLSCTALSHLLCLLYSPSFSTPLPPWLCYFAGFILFAYQTIDNLDGRQARRTSSSSPLGLLFDHGVDAINVTISTMVMMAILQLGTNAKLFYLWSTVFIPFVCATWEEYYTGSLVLAEVNGPTDGVFLCIVFCIIAGYNPAFWTNSFATNFPLLAYTPIGSLATHWFVIGGGWLSVAATVAGNCREIAKRTALSTAVVTLLPFLALHLSALAWLTYSPSGVFVRHPRVFLFACGFLFCNLVCKLMLAHITAQVYRPWRTVLVPWLVGIGLVFGSRVVMKGGLGAGGEDVVLGCLLLLNGGFWLHFTVSVITEITGILGIHAFSITKQREQVVRASQGKASPSAKTAGHAYAAAASTH